MGLAFPCAVPERRRLRVITPFSPKMHADAAAHPQAYGSIGSIGRTPAAAAWSARGAPPGPPRRGPNVLQLLLHPEVLSAVAALSAFRIWQGPAVLR